MNPVAELAPVATDLTALGRAVDGVSVERIHYGPPSGAPQVSIIIPCRSGERTGLLGSLLDDLHDQDLGAFEVLLVIGDNRQGRAINRGVRESEADIIATMDDDTLVLSPDLLRRLIEPLKNDASIGIIGASTVVPPNASRLQRAASHQLPRRLFPVVSELTDSDMVQHPCLAMRKDFFFEIGGEDEELVRGLDPLLRYKARRAGKRVAVAPQCYVAHPLPESLRKIVGLGHRNGRGSAFAQKNYPHRIYHLDDGHSGDDFPTHVAFPKRALGFVGRFANTVMRGHVIRLCHDIAYATGYLREISKRD